MRRLTVSLSAVGLILAACGSSGGGAFSIRDGRDWDAASIGPKEAAARDCRDNLSAQAQETVSATRILREIDQHYENSAHADDPIGDVCDAALRRSRRRVKVVVSGGTDATTTSDTYTVHGTVKPADARITLAHRNVESANVTRHGASFTIALRLHHGLNGFQIRAGLRNYRTGTSPATVTRKYSPTELAAIRERKAEAKAQARADFVANAQTIPYGELDKDADSYRGQKIKIYGQVFQIQQSPLGGGIMLVSVTNEGYGIWDDNVWVDYSGKVPQTEDDLITLYGTVTGSKTYQTQIGGETYVPRVRAKYIDGVN